MDFIIYYQTALRTTSLKIASFYFAAIDLIKKMMTVDPKKRITLAEAMNHPWFKDEEMKKKAKKLMYPHSDNMGPPSQIISVSRKVCSLVPSQ